MFAGPKVNGPALPDGRALVRELARVSATMPQRFNRRVLGFGEEIFDVAAKIARHAGTVTAASNGSWMTLEHEREGPFIVSIGEKDRVILADEFVGEAHGLSLFMPGWTQGSDRRATLFWISHHGELLGRMGLNPPEFILVAKNQVFSGLRPTPLGRFLDRMDALLELAATLPLLPPTRSGCANDQVEMPDQLRQLADLATAWALSDDVDRTERIEAASDGALEDLYARVAPYFACVNELLDSGPDPLPPELVITGRLAEAATEADIELTRRRERQ